MIIRFFIILGLILFSNQVYAEGYGYKYLDGGGVYTNITMPNCIYKDSQQHNIDINKLKKGKSTTTNILGLVQTGNAGILAAAKEAGITKIYFVEWKKTKVYVPLGFIPIYVAGIETIVYGE